MISTHLGADSRESGSTAAGVAPASPGGNENPGNESLQAVAMNEGIRRKGLWTERGRQQLASLSLMPWTTRRRQELLELLDRLDPNIEELSQAIKQEAEQVPEVKLLMTHPGVGAITALAFVLVIGTPERFGCGKQVASYFD